MPLSQEQITLLHNKCTTLTGTLSNVDLADIQPEACACWRWASSGLKTDIIADPSQVFTAIGFGTALNANSIWHAEEEQTNLVQTRSAQRVAYATGLYQPINGKSWNAWFIDVATQVAQRTCEIGNVNVDIGDVNANHGVHYYIVMHYDKEAPNADRMNPNYTHWWVKIQWADGNFVCIETFPQYAHLTFRWNTQYADNQNITLEVSDLSEAHLDILDIALCGLG